MSTETDRLNALRQSLEAEVATQKTSLAQLEQQLSLVTRSLEQTRAEKEKTLADMAAGEEQAARKLTSLTAAHEQAVQQLRQQLDQTAHSLEQTRAEKGKDPGRHGRRGGASRPEAHIPHRHP